MSKLSQIMLLSKSWKKNYNCKYILNYMTTNINKSLHTTSRMNQVHTMLLCERCHHSINEYHSRNLLQVNTILPQNPMKQYSSTVEKIKKALGITGKMKYPKAIMNMSALRMYLCCVELVDHDVFVKEFNLPDTFNSWFRLTELHMWMLLVRLYPEGKEGIFIRDQMVKFMWEDINKRTRKLGGPNSYVKGRKEGVQRLGIQFKYTLYGYDEGLLKDDHVLAGAIWRSVFESGEFHELDVNHLETLVAYVRKQVDHLEKQDSAVLLTSGLITLLPLHGETDDKERTKRVLLEICDRYRCY